jgi:hypothetical protein
MSGNKGGRVCSCASRSLRAVPSAAAARGSLLVAAAKAAGTATAVVVAASVRLVVVPSHVWLVVWCTAVVVAASGVGGAVDAMVGRIADGFGNKIVNPHGGGGGTGEGAGAGVVEGGTGAEGRSLYNGKGKTAKGDPRPSTVAACRSNGMNTSSSHSNGGGGEGEAAPAEKNDDDDDNDMPEVRSPLWL